MDDITRSEPLWKQTLRAQLETVLISVPSGIELERDDFPLDTSDLYHFYEELVVFRNEFRKGNRRIVETFTQMGNTLGELNSTVAKVHGEILSADDEPSEASIPRAHILNLIELDDRLRRLVRKMGTPPTPPKRLWKSTPEEWPNAWTNVQQAAMIAHEHSARLLESVGVTAIAVEGEDFDPTRMNAVARDSKPGVPQNQVVEEVTRGYMDASGQPIRLAEVRVNIIDSK